MIIMKRIRVETRPDVDEIATARPTTHADSSNDDATLLMRLMMTRLTKISVNLAKQIAKMMMQ
jgi:hypothetical protein